MKLMNPLQMNDWPIKSFLGIILSLQIFYLGLIVLDLINIHIPVMRELISFIVLTFVPGILILRILKIHNIGSVPTVLYSVGLSIGALMSMGLIINIICPLFGFNTPISLYALFITFTFGILLFCIFVYVRDKNFTNPNFIELNEILSPYFLILCFIPFLSIFGTYLLNIYDVNVLQMILLVIIAIFPIVTLKWIPKKLYPFVIFVLSISLLYHTTLVGQFSWGADINTELFLANNVLTKAFWNPSIASNVNAMLSITILAPTYSLLSNLSIPWCFKIIYPTIFSLVPVSLFVVYEKLTDEKIALLSCVFFISVSAYFTTLPSAARQEVAELFLALIILIIIDGKLNGVQKSFLLLLFGFSLVISHYGVSYILLLIMGGSVLIILLLSILPAPMRIKMAGFENFKVINTVFPLFILCFALAWFIYVSDASIFNDVGILVKNIYGSVTDVLNPQKSQAYNLISGTMPVFQSIERYLYLISEILIGIGILNLFFNSSKINTEFKAFSLASFCILMIGIFFPYFASAMNTDRLLHINLFFLAVYFVTGALILIKIVNFILGKSTKIKSSITVNKSLYLICVFLVIFSIFNTAFIYQISDQPKLGRFALDNNVDFYTVNYQEISAVDWLKNNRNQQTMLYADIYKYLVIGSLFNSDDNTDDLNIDIDAYYRINPLLNNTLNSSISPSALKDSYVFFGTFNIKNNEYIVNQNSKLIYIQNQRIQNNINKIYDNGNALILKGTGS